MTDTDELRRVAPEDWLAAVRSARDDGYRHFDWLGCVDEIGRQDALTVVVRLLRFEPQPAAIRVSTAVPRNSPELTSIGSVFAGAGWHEREGTDLFGIRFLGGDPRALLIEEPYAEPPLRKDQVLGARSATPWPGSEEPGEDASSSGRAPSRRRTMPAGVPDPEIWGDRQHDEPATPDEVAESLSAGRVRRRRRAGPS